MNITIAQADHAVTYTATTEPQLRRLIQRLTPTIERKGDWIVETRAGIKSWRLSDDGEEGFALQWKLAGLWERLPLATRREIVAFARVQVRRRSRVLRRRRGGVR